MLHIKTSDLRRRTSSDVTLKSPLVCRKFCVAVMLRPQLLQVKQINAHSVMILQFVLRSNDEEKIDPKYLHCGRGWWAAASSPRSSELRWGGSDRVASVRVCVERNEKKVKENKIDGGEVSMNRNEKRGIGNKESTVKRLCSN